MTTERFTGSQTDSAVSAADLTGKEFYAAKRTPTGLNLCGAGDHCDGVISEGKKEVHFSDLFFVDLYTLPEDASTTYGNTVSVLFGEHESEDYWKIRYATENLDNDPFFLARLAAAVADKKAKDAKAALAETARAEAEANIPVTRQMTRAIEEAERCIESIKNYTLPANPTPDNYKGMATKQVTKRMLEMFVALCGSLRQELNGEYHRITPTEAFGMVVARTVNDSHYCPRELFADAVQEFKWNANINY